MVPLIDSHFPHLRPSLLCCFNNFRMFRKVGEGVSRLGLGHFEDTRSPIMLCALGGFCVSALGVLVPPTMFWSKVEIGSIAEPGRDLPHIWPQVNRGTACVNISERRTPCSHGFVWWFS